MSEEREKHFQRNRGASSRSRPTRALTQRDEVKPATLHDSIKEESQSGLSRVTSFVDESSPFAYSPNTLQALDKWCASESTEVINLLKDKALRMVTRRQERRLSKLRTDRKIQEKSNNEVSLLALHKVMDWADEYLKKDEAPPKNMLRVNQEKQMNKQLAAIDENIENANFSAVKTGIQGLLKRFGKDEYIASSLNHFNYIAKLTESYERQQQAVRDISNYMFKFSSIESTPEEVVPSIQSLKTLKKELGLAHNKEKRKADPNDKLIDLISMSDKLSSLMTELLEVKKPEPEKIKRNPTLAKSVGGKQESGDGELQKYCQDILQKSSKDTSILFKQLDTLRRNNKKKNDPPYALVLRVYDCVQAQKKDINELNIYLKTLSQTQLRKNIQGDKLAQEINKVEEKYAKNELLVAIKSNLDGLSKSIIDREKSTQNTNALEKQVATLKKENEKLKKQTTQQKNKLTDSEQRQKKRELEEKKSQSVDKLKAQKEDKEIEKVFQTIKSSISDKKWKVAKNTITTYLKKNEGSTSLPINRSIQSLTAINVLFQEVDQLQQKLQASQSQGQSKGTEKSKDWEEALALISKVQKGQWWKGLPKANKNVNVKPVYDLLNRLKDTQIAIKKHELNDTMFEEDRAMVGQALDAADKLTQKEVFATPQAWQNAFQPVKVNKTCERMLKQFTRLTSKGIKAGKNYDDELQKMSTMVNDLERRIAQNEKQSQLSESRRSTGDLRGSRRMSRSREKDSMKGNMQEYIQQERKMLTTIQELEDEKKKNEQRNVQLESRLLQLEDARNDWEGAKSALQMDRLDKVKRITELEGELEITEGRLTDMQSRLEAEIDAYKNLNESTAKELQEAKVALSASRTPQKTTSAFARKQSPAIYDKKELQEKILIIKNLQRELGQNEAKILEEQRALENERKQLKRMTEDNNNQKKEIQRLHHVVEDLQKRPVSMENTDLQQYQLRAQIKRLQLKMAEEEERHHQQVEGEVNAALQSQQQGFDDYIKQLEQEKQHHFLQVVLPRKLEEAHQEWEVGHQGQGVSVGTSPVQKDKDWAVRERQIESYWISQIENNKKLWQSDKQKSISQALENARAENDRLWQNRINNEILPQRLRQAQQAQVTHSGPIDKQLVIDEWKKNNLPDILQQEGTFAIQYFIDNDLPNILEQERRKWEADQKSNSKVGSAASGSSQLWEQQKQESIKREQQLGRMLHEAQAQVLEEQEKLLRQQERIAGLGDKAIAQWKINELPTILRREREASVQVFKDQQLPKLLSQNQSSQQKVVERVVEKIVEVPNTRQVDEERARWEAKVSLLQNQHRQSLAKERQNSQNELHRLQREWLEKMETKASPLTQKDRSPKQQSPVQQQKFDKVREVEKYWQDIVLPEKEQQWKKNQKVRTDRLLESKVHEVEKEFNERIIPSIIKEQRASWDNEVNSLNILKKKVEDDLKNCQQRIHFLQGELNQKQRSLNETLARSQGTELEKQRIEGELRHNADRVKVLQSQLVEQQGKVQEVLARSQASHSEMAQVRSQQLQIESELTNYKQRAQFFEAQLKQKDARAADALTRSQAVEQQINLIRSQQREVEQRTGHEVHRLNEQLRRSKVIQQEAEDLKRIVERQREELRGSSVMAKEFDWTRQELNKAQEQLRNIENSKWTEGNRQRAEFDATVQKLNKELTLMSSRLADAERRSQDPANNEKMQSIERQLATLTATLQTKDAEINFLKTTTESLRKELHETKETGTHGLGAKVAIEKELGELKKSLIEREYEIKYAQEREQGLIKRLEAKDEEIARLGKSESAGRQALEGKLRVNLENVSAAQIKVSELESMLNIKNKEVQVTSQELSRLNYEIQRLEGSSKSLMAENEVLKRKIKDYDIAIQAHHSERERLMEEVSREKISRVNAEQRSEDLRRQVDEVAGRSRQLEQQKQLVEEDFNRMKSNIALQQANFEQTQRSAKSQAERLARVERDLEQAKSQSQQVEPREIELLGRINQDVTELTVANRQLQTKCVLLQNRNMLNSSQSQVMNFYLLVQKHTDLLIEHLVREGLVHQLDQYHRFIDDSQALLANGQAEEYFAKWDGILRQVCASILKKRSEEMRLQAQELLRLRDEMTDVLDKQIQASESEQGELVSDYRAVLADIKGLVKEYVRSGDQEYISLLCGSLGIPA